MYGTSAGTKNRGRCEEVIIAGRWPLEDVGLYIKISNKCLLAIALPYLLLKYLTAVECLQVNVFSVLRGQRN